jgi:hypothetical protein
VSAAVLGYLISLVRDLFDRPKKPGMKQVEEPAASGR